MAISTRRMSDVLASTNSGRLYRIEVFLLADEPGRTAPPPAETRYILRTTDGEHVTALDDRRYRLRSGEVLTALSTQRPDI